MKRSRFCMARLAKGITLPLGKILTQIKCFKETVGLGLR